MSAQSKPVNVEKGKQGFQPTEKTAPVSDAGLGSGSFIAGMDEPAPSSPEQQQAVMSIMTGSKVGDMDLSGLKIETFNPSTEPVMAVGRSAAGFTEQRPAFYDYAAGDVPHVHEFGDTGTGYDATQTSESIKDGDLLCVPDEKVVGFLHQAWPIAVSTEKGDFHGAKSKEDFLAQFPQYTDIWDECERRAAAENFTKGENE